MQQFQIGDPSAVAPARRGITTLAAELGFDAEDAGRAALVATEIGTNLVKHGGGGELIAQKISRDNRVGLELLGLDKGPGMDDVAKCLRDGYSTSSSPGTGLGAMERLSQRFEIYSRPGRGTAVLAQLWQDSREPPPGRTQVGALVVPKPGEVACGDRWCCHERVEGPLVVAVDGLGHGLGAEQAATEACRVFETEKHRPALRLMQSLHEALRPTRGAAVTLLEVDWDAGRIASVGVGNVAAALINGTETKRIATDNGIVGHVISRPRELVHPVQPGTVLILHSDGLTASWQADRYPGLMQHHPALIAGVLYRDCKRGRDDSLIVVIRRTPP
ncbi:TorS-related protein [Steroidobacter agaridevorans]|uniref:TorS-related protein n=1 Tax=Steroidobacter agaridevorans TaxID=2695856 RepID=A0A829YDW4_9GAMM|nr:ATP-binding SpoIIE family protein phosphatase [Steroidobacter agaridevorans]GFE81457.1 TorS-related protein [Steroidobacter agaridevorans]GFE88661.1 TorS-related protein [Steroidobacter agaridevorans]